ncbi:MAG: DUF1446 domain-containing protein [Actinobacteria bacterium]|nr:DUF1446 domain-containing protein [Actinomycetota bacterium]
MGAMIRIANCSGFYGDRLAAARELVEGGPIDVLTGDYLAELTMLLLARSEEGYAKTFLRQMEDVLGTCVERGIKVVANAGGLNPAGLAERVRVLGTGAAVAHVEGDDLRDRFPGALTANAYLGAWGIVEALRGGADVVVTGRVADASLVVAPAAWRFGWRPDQWDALAGAVVAGHVLECGAHATGGNYAFFREVPGLAHPGFPIAEVHEDGSSVITKHEGTGGLVSVGTVTAQLLYEIGGPAYVSPDAVARFDTIRLEQEEPDRVRISGVRGGPPPPELKVCVNELGGFRNSMTFVLTGLEIEEKAAVVREALLPRLDGVDADVRLLPCEDGAQLRVVVRSPDEKRVGRAFSGAAIELALASYPGFHTTTPPGDASPFGVYRPAFVPAGSVEQAVVWEDGTRTRIEPAPTAAPADTAPPPLDLPAPPAGPTRRLPLGAVFGARSGDKGGDANVGVWAREPLGYAWLAEFLTADCLKELVPEAASLTVRRYELPNLLALNFVVEGLLGEGVAASTRPDPQAKSLGEYLRSRPVDLPEALL